MRLKSVGQWAHPCAPWLTPETDDLFPAGRAFHPKAIVHRLEVLQSWKTSQDPALLIERIEQSQGLITANSMRQILSGDASVVLTGQQPSFAGGPMFVWLKAWEAIAQARRLTQETGTKVVALFWIAGDDSDLEEVRHFANPITSQTVDAHQGVVPGAPVGELPISPDCCQEIAHTVMAWWPDSRLPKVISSGQNLSQIMLQCLREWFGDQLVIVDAAWPEVRSRAASVYDQFVNRVSEVHLALEQGMQKSRDLGLPVGLRSWPDRARVFSFRNQGRVRLEKHADTWVGIPGQNLSQSELSKLIKQDPAQFSHDVVSRPFAAEAIFPVLAHVLGPGEMGYFACLGPLSEFLNRPLAPAFPRASATVLGKLPTRLLPEVGWDVSSHKPARWDEWENRFLRGRSTGLDSWKANQVSAREKYLQTLGVDSLSAQGMALQQSMQSWELRSERTRLRQSRGLYEQEISELRRVWNLAGNGGLQERLWSPWALEHALAFPDLLCHLNDALQMGMHRHQVLGAA